MIIKIPFNKSNLNFSSITNITFHCFGKFKFKKNISPGSIALSHLLFYGIKGCNLPEKTALVMDLDIYKAVANQNTTY